MNLILLGGNSIDNKKWIEDIDNCLRPLFQSTTIINYDHWQTGEWMINLDKEKEKLVKIAKECGDYIIFAKSAGSVVTVKAIFEKLISPQKCIFIGVPLKWAKKNSFDIESWYQNLSIPTMIIQHTNDPFATTEELKSFFFEKSFTPKFFHEISGDTHDYDELDIIKKLVSDFVE